jgi:hypothetical protein
MRTISCLIREMAIVQATSYDSVENLKIVLCTSKLYILNVNFVERHSHSKGRSRRQFSEMFISVRKFDVFEHSKYGHY